MFRNHYPAVLVAVVVAAVGSTPARADLFGHINNGSSETIVLRMVTPDALEGVLEISAGHALDGPVGTKLPKAAKLKKAKDGAPLVRNCSRDVIGNNGTSYKMELVQSKGREATWPKYTFDLKLKGGNLVFSNLVPANKPSWKASLVTVDGAPAIAISDVSE